MTEPRRGLHPASKIMLTLAAAALLFYAGHQVERSSSLPAVPVPIRRSSAVDTPERVVLRGYLEAFNRHDAAAVAATLASGVKWYSVDSDKVSVEAEDRDAVARWFESYFRQNPDVRSEFLSLEQTGTYVAVRERVTWTPVGAPRRTQESHAIFEIRQGAITRVWYFPAVREP